MAKGLIVVLVIGGAGLIYPAAAQTNPPASQTQAKKPVATAAAAKKPVKKAPVHVATQRTQTAPTSERIVEIQKALGREGFSTGTPNGKWDAVTTQAMKDFQTAKGLTPTGTLNALSLQKLGLGSEIAGRGAPLPPTNAKPSPLTDADLNGAEPADSPAN